ncbi:unnamed protein product [Nesidiocoris tenuis]|uniref:Uncharacterized protein n=1 Tax=Nesidiocoris tenuis TaxID=355587 RepID=A0A6H5HI88_9HEMI|nr:unnamed protein product [Nesidiocoris tenuis]
MEVKMAIAPSFLNLFSNLLNLNVYPGKTKHPITMSNLLCTESVTGETRALVDQQMCTSQKVFDNLLKLEMRYVPRMNPINSAQRTITSEHRRVCTSWMLEVRLIIFCH